MGFSFTVNVEMGWTLTRADTGAIVWRESIKSAHTTGAGEAFAGVERLRLATEGAAPPSSPSPSKRHLRVALPFQAGDSANISRRSSAPMPGASSVSDVRTAFASSALRPCISWIFSSSVPRAISL